MTEDMWNCWAADAAAQREKQDAREHRTMSALLIARGQRAAAAVLAASTYTSDCVDNWDGGQYEVVIAVPAVLFDRIDSETRAALEHAAKDIVGVEHFRGLVIQVRLMDPEPGWQQVLLQGVFRPSGEAALSPLALPPGDDGEG